MSVAKGELCRYVGRSMGCMGVSPRGSNGGVVMFNKADGFGMSWDMVWGGNGDPYCCW